MATFAALSDRVSSSLHDFVDALSPSRASDISRSVTGAL
jgi:hypothetical protein